MRNGDAALHLPQPGYGLVSATVQTVTGVTKIKTLEEEQVLPKGLQASWATNSPDTFLEPISISVPQTAAEAIISWVAKKRYLSGCDCQDITVDEELCDVTGERWEFPARSADSEQRSWDVFAGVTLENLYGRSGIHSGGYLLVRGAGSSTSKNTFTFSEPVNVDFGVTFLPVGLERTGESLKMSPGMELYEINEEFADWDPAQNVLALKPEIAGGHMGEGQNYPAVAKFRSAGVREINFEHVLGKGDSALVFMSVDGFAGFPFTRSTTKDCFGTIKEIVDTSSDGSLYEAKGVVQRCEDECYPPEITQQVCDYELEGFLVPLTENTRNWDLPFDVSLSTNAGQGSPSGYHVDILNGPHTFTYTQPVNTIEIMISFVDGTVPHGVRVLGMTFQPDSSASIFSWNEETKTLTTPGGISVTDSEGKPLEARFSGWSSDQFQLEMPLPESGIVETQNVVRMTFLKTIKARHTPIIRKTTYECDGTVVSEITTTLDGEPYVLNGVITGCPE